MSAFTGAIFTAAEIEDDRIVYTIHDGSFTQAVYTGGVLNRGYHTDPHSGQLSTLVMFLVQNYLRIE